jgi:hypothetical protein
VTGGSTSPLPRRSTLPLASSSGSTSGQIDSARCSSCWPSLSCLVLLLILLFPLEVNCETVWCLRLCFKPLLCGSWANIPRSLSLQCCWCTFYLLFFILMLHYV